MNCEKATKGASPHVYPQAFDDSPNRSHSQSIYGRSAREMDEEIMKLRNENFNLKLRLHFKDQAAEAEGGPRVSSFSDGAEKELEDAKAIINALRIEVNEKTQLLKDAAVAITEHEDKEREFIIESRAKIAELEAYIVHMQEEKNPLEAILVRDLKLMEEQVAQKVDELHQTKMQIDQLKLELAEYNQKFSNNEQKVQLLCSENAEMLKLLQQHYQFSLLANHMMDIQKKELDECFIEKQAFIKKMNGILPELYSQNELLREATITVQSLLEKTGLKEKMARRMLDNYKSAILESKAEIQNVTEDMVKWLQAHGVAIDLCPDSSSNSDQSSEESIQPSECDPLKNLGSADHKKGVSSGKRLRFNSKRSFTGLRQFVKCWGSKYAK